MTVLADLLVATDRPSEGLFYAREAHAVLEDTMPEGHWRTAAAMYAEGSALLALGEFEHAESLLLNSQPGLEQAPIPDLSDKGRQRLAELYLAWGKPDKAAEFDTALTGR